MRDINANQDKWLEGGIGEHRIIPNQAMDVKHPTLVKLEIIVIFSSCFVNSMNKNGARCS
jgi:hypothetical protein